MKLRRILSIIFLMLGMTFYATLGFSSHTATTGPMGEMKEDVKAKKAFEEGKMIPGYTYYYIGGSIIEPDSIIALKKGYMLEEHKTWSKVLDMEDKVIRTWIQAWKNDGHFLSDLHGGVLLDSEGKEVGIWYSHYPSGAVMEPVPGVFHIFPPHPLVGKRPGQGA